jgi:23S rRNA pseudouridine2605 synthase
MVSRLTRTRYGIVSLPPQLKRGQTVEMERGELNALLKAAGLPLLDGTRDERVGGRGADRAEQQGPMRSHEDDQPIDELDAGPEVDGNRGTYGIPAEPEFDDVDEIDGNRAPPQTSVAKPASAPRHKHAQPAHVRGPNQPKVQGAHPRAPGGGQARGPASAPNQGRGRRGRRGGRGGRNGPGAPQPA